MVINVQNIELKKGSVLGIEIDYPKTKFLSITVSNIGYVMCGILDVKILDALHLERRIIAAKIPGASNLMDLLSLQITEVTETAAKIGIKVGMTGEEAINGMLDAKIPK
ncbi:MAG: DUF1805 domain-containing protein [Firmicutes bacterium HGW-Firmicutes-7]|nr:MAG: DUF1805 domain-containing protein [Firmicutes bacterium HGW-Firmicutes-7]